MGCPGFVLCFSKKGSFTDFKFVCIFFQEFWQLLQSNGDTSASVVLIVSVAVPGTVQIIWFLSWPDSFLLLFDLCFFQRIGGALPGQPSLQGAAGTVWCSVPPALPSRPPGRQSRQCGLRTKVENRENVTHTEDDPKNFPMPCLKNLQQLCLSEAPLP